uniref:Large ribosomal subunit protein bL19c n=1 Tax=Cyanidium caldarium TaxID=2771 RepID=RK19_CYACA|nr:ribosomal protein L19 [Cyanidium caldarium]Q9TM06.1 RecName: Full=Large ribosomal subunit protein bL19c; AltName: Full=50S ribosomal protein L19, chloroplastic [Cyanidium caldarium]AAF12984.1 unknown [Cyanidium caldarium]WDB00237.1 ribosomal protein L19 [Cyanidium caldarium]
MVNYLSLKNNISSNLFSGHNNINQEPICVGDYIRFGLLITEGTKERTQNCEGLVIAKRFSNTCCNLTVRTVFQGIGVERTISLFSPKISKIKILKHYKVRRAKLYYLRRKENVKKK